MTGLDPETDQILEIYCIITNGQLDVLHEGWGCVVNQPLEVMNRMVRHSFILSLKHFQCWYPHRANGVQRRTGIRGSPARSHSRKSLQKKQRMLYWNISRSMCQSQTERCWLGTAYMRTKRSWARDHIRRWLIISIIGFLMLVASTNARRFGVGWMCWSTYRRSRRSTRRRRIFLRVLLRRNTTKRPSLQRRRGSDEGWDRRRSSRRVAAVLKKPTAPIEYII